MIQANELRIGNYMYITHAYFNESEVGTIQVDDIVRMCTNISTYVYEPIPITEEWLLKFGFEKNKFRIAVYDLVVVLPNSAFIMDVDFLVNTSTNSKT